MKKNIFHLFSFVAFPLVLMVIGCTDSKSSVEEQEMEQTHNSATAYVDGLKGDVGKARGAAAKYEKGAEAEQKAVNQSENNPN